MFSNNKNEKWLKHRKRLKDALESNVHDNQIDNLKENFKLLRNDEFDKCKGNLLQLSLKNASKDCALFLIEKGDITNPCFIPLECKYARIHIVCELLQELVDEYPENFTSASGSRPFSKLNIDKKYLIKRILDPVKISANPGRVDYIMDNKFFNTKDIKEVIDENFKIKPEKWSALISLLRDIKLKELGI
jgi:hypothetical protein